MDRREVLSSAFGLSIIGGIFGAGYLVQENRRFSASRPRHNEGPLTKTLNESGIYESLRISGGVVFTEFEPNPVIASNDLYDATDAAELIRFDAGYLGPKAWESSREDVPEYRYRTTYPAPTPGATIAHKPHPIQTGWYRVGTKLRISEGIFWKSLDFKIEKAGDGAWQISDDWVTIINA